MLDFSEDILPLLSERLKDQQELHTEGEIHRAIPRPDIAM